MIPDRNPHIPLSSFVAAWIVLLCLGISGCDTAFNPLIENRDRHYSVFGVLDQAADTQWVRVMPVGDSLFSGKSVPNEVRVYLTELESGNRTELRDSLIRYSDNVYAWNYWTDSEIKSGSTYKLEVIGPGEKQSSAETTIPEDFRVPEITYNTRQERGVVVVEEVERLVVAEAEYVLRVIPNEPGPPPPLVTESISHLDNLVPLKNNGYKFYPNDVSRLAEKLNAFGQRIDIQKRTIRVVAGSAEWPDYEQLSKDEIPIPGIRSNVKNGLGVLAGIVSKEFVIE